MLKTFIAGVLLGIAAAAAAVNYIPTVDQHRERSMILVQPNGGNTEAFHINVPTDRILVGAPAQPEGLPVGLNWPQIGPLTEMRAELFKIRNGRDTVVGVASRVVASNIETGDIIEWVLHLPARGSVYINMQTEALEGGYRIGRFRAGTREFSTLSGQIIERWIADTSGSEGAQEGQIELSIAFVSTEEPTL